MHTDLLTPSTQPSLALVALLLLSNGELLRPIPAPVQSTESSQAPRTVVLTPVEEPERLAA